VRTFESNLPAYACREFDREKQKRHEFHGLTRIINIKKSVKSVQSVAFLLYAFETDWLPTIQANQRVLILTPIWLSCLR